MTMLEIERKGYLDVYGDGKNASKEAAIPFVQVYWLKDGYRLDETNNIRVTAEGSLIFEQISVADTANYTCVAENLMKTRYSNTVPLTVIGQ